MLYYYDENVILMIKMIGKLTSGKAGKQVVQAGLQKLSHCEARVVPDIWILMSIVIMLMIFMMKDNMMMMNTSKMMTVSVMVIVSHAFSLVIFLMSKTGKGM